MPRKKRKLQLLAAFTVLLVFAFGAGCRGFFVNPTLTTITINPASPQVQQGATLQLTATGTFDDGSVSTSIKNLNWSSGSTSVATIGATSGLLNAISTGQSTITASSANVTGTSSVTVVLANVTSIQVSPSSTSILTSQTASFTAKATVSGQSTPVDITGTATWTLASGGAAVPAGLFTTTFSNGNEVIQVIGTPPTLPYVVQVTASSPGANGTTINSNPATLTVN